MSLEAKTYCPECQESIDDADSLEAGECLWCGAFLVNVGLKINTSESSETKTTPGLFDDITVSEDESLVMPRPSKVKHSVKKVEDNFSLESILSQFKQEQKGKPKPKPKPKLKARSKRKQIALSDSSDDEWVAPAPTRRKKTEESKSRKPQSLYNSDQDWDPMDQESDGEKHYDPAFSNDSGSEYHESDSEDDSWLTKLKHPEKGAIKQEEEEKPSRLIKLSKSRAGKASTRPTTSSAKASSSSTPKLKETDPNRVHSFLKFNMEVRGRLAKENKDLSPKDLSRVVSSLWNAMSQDQKAEYANKKYTPKLLKPPSGNPYITYKNEQFHLVQKEFKLKGDTAMRKASSIISVRWKNLDPSIKEEYKAKAKKLREDWALEHPKEYDAYMDNMKAKVSESKRRAFES